MKKLSTSFFIWCVLPSAANAQDRVNTRAVTSSENKPPVIGALLKSIKFLNQLT